ncbi:MAG: ATP-binding protein [Spirochaetota bacterium]
MIITYINFIKKHYPDVDINSLLEYAEISLHELEDLGYWYTQRQSDLFHEILVKKTGNVNISRETGRFASKSGSYNLIRQYMLGFITVEAAYSSAGHISSKLTRGGTVKTRKLGHNKVEISARPEKDVMEKPYQCEARLGLFEAVPTMFNNKFSNIEHPLCIHKGDEYCKYIVSWDKPASFQLKLIRNYLSLFAVLLSITSFIFLPVLYSFITFLLCSGAVLGLSNYYERKKNKELIRASESQGNTAEQLLEEINNRFNNALLIQEIGQAISSILDMDDLFASIMEILEKRTDFDSGIILLADDNASKLVYKAGYGYDPAKEEILKNTEFHLNRPKSKGIFVRTFKEQKPFLINDINDIINDMSPRSKEFVDQIGTKSFITVPIAYKEKPLGILAIDNAGSRRPLNISDMNLLSGIAQQIGISINNARSFAELKRHEEKIKHLNEVLLAILNIDHLITHEKDSDRLMKDICDKLALTNGHGEAWIVLFDEKGKFSRAFESGFTEDFRVFTEKFRNDVMPGCCEKALSEPDTVVIDNPDIKCGDCGFKSKYCKTLRMLNRLKYDDKTYGIMSVALKPDFISNNEEPRLLKEVADEIAFALYNIELEQERKTLQEQLFQSAKLSAVGQLASGVAHEFNNILHVILGHAQLILDEESIAADIKESLQQIEKSTKRGSGIINKLSVFATPKDPDFAIQDITDVIKETVKLQKKQTQLENIDVRLEFGEHSDVLFDRDQMGQVFLNLLINSIHAIKPKGRGNIIISVKDTDRHLEIRFSDTGIGMSRETMNKIFDPFFSTKGAYAKDDLGITGTGLGLSVTHTIIKQHNATISVESEEGKGATFIMKLPFPEGNEIIKVKKTFNKTDMHIEISKNIKIMIIDDEEEVINLMMLTLKKGGFNNIIAEKDGRKAARIFNEFCPDVVFLDILMPIINGEQVFEELKQVNREVPVVFMTGKLDGNENEYQNKGVYDFLKKPFKADNIFRILNKIAGEKGKATL